MRNDVVSASRSRYGRRTRKPRADQPWLWKKHWTESEYLELDTNNLLEFKNGKLVVLPMPNELHQTIAGMFLNLLINWSPRGKVMFAPFKVKLKMASGEYREPDVVYLMDRNDPRRGPEFWTGADLVIEIISKGGVKRDTVEKRADYAASGIPEYWIVDPKLRTITVLRLEGTTFLEHGVFKSGERATPVVLKEFAVDVDTIMNAD